MNAWKDIGLPSITPVRAFNLTAAEWQLREFTTNTTGRLDSDVGRQTTVGPAQSDIVRLAYGLSFLTATLLTTLAIMGFTLSFRRRRSPPEAMPPLESDYNPPYQAPTASQLRSSAEARAAGEKKMTAEIRRCADLLRQMYRLDLQIWTAEGDPDEDEASRQEQERLRRKADAIFAEVRAVAGRWQTGEWTEAEATPLAAIYQAIAREPANRYQRGYGGFVANYPQNGATAPSPQQQSPRQSTTLPPPHRPPPPSPPQEHQHQQPPPQSQFQPQPSYQGLQPSYEQPRPYQQQEPQPYQPQEQYPQHQPQQPYQQPWHPPPPRQQPYRQLLQRQ